MMSFLIFLCSVVCPFEFLYRKRSRSRDRHRDRDRSSRKRKSSSRSPSKGSTKDNKEMSELKSERDDSLQPENIIPALPLKTKPYVCCLRN